MIDSFELMIKKKKILGTNTFVNDNNNIKNSLNEFFKTRNQKNF